MSPSTITVLLLLLLLLCAAALTLTYRRLVQLKEQQQELQKKLRRLSAQQQSALHSGRQNLESVQALSGGIAHDINNFLQPILGNMELLCEQLEQEPQLRQLALTSQQAAERCTALTGKLQAFAGRLRLRPDCVVLDDFLNTLRYRIETPAKKKNIQVTLTVDAGPVALVDREGLAAALLEVSANAMAAMKEGGSLTIHADCPSAAETRIIVCDTGPGLSVQDCARVFEPYFTEENDGRKGLGLSVVYGFVRQSGGQITLQSKPGEGTSVTMIFPASDTSAGQRAA